MNTTRPHLTLSAQDKDLRNSPATIAGRCDDLNKVRAVHCQRDAGHPDLHRSGLFVWGAQDPWMPEWRRNLQAKDLTDRSAA